MGLKKVLLIAAGSLAVALGFVGIFLPILPTTPFMLMAAACFSVSSPKLYEKLAKSKYFGQFVKNYKEKTGVERAVKIKALLFLWITLLISSVVFFSPLVVGILMAVGIGVTIHIWTLREK